MQVEWELTLECNYRCHYCTNGRNDCLKEPIYPELDDSKIINFIKKLNEKYPDTEIFLFGGEPFKYPKLALVLRTLNSLNQKYVIQTNFSNPDFGLIREYNAKIQVSIHRTQIQNLNKTFENLLRVNKYIRRIDIMYTSVLDEQLYDKWDKWFFGRMFLTPVSDFGIYTNSNNSIYKSLLEFCDLKIKKPRKCEASNRCFVWLDMLDGKVSTKGKPCLYKDFYVLYAPDLKSYNCSHRLNTEICPFGKCFLMDFKKFKNTTPE